MRERPASRERCGAPGPASLRAWAISSIGFLVLVAIACVVVYFPSRNGPFVLDDLTNILENPHVRMTRLDLASLWRAMVPYENLNLRPLSFLTFALNHLYGGYDPFWYHAVNIAVLLMSIPLAYLLALRLGGVWMASREARATALGATAVWALHPLLTSGVSYVVQRMTALYALFSLAALLFFLGGRLAGRLGFSALAAGSLLCALASKETALFTPLLAVLVLWLLPREKGGAGARAGWALAGLVVASQAAMILAAQYALRVKWIPAPAIGMAERFMTEGRVVLRYLELFFLPLPSEMTFDYAFPLSTSLLTPPATLLAAVFHAVLIAGAVRVRRRRPLLAFGILGFYLLQLSEGTFMPLDLIFEHRAYLPSFFLALALMDLLQWAIGWRGALATAVALAALWGSFGYQRNLIWADPVKLWEDTVAKAPGNPRAHCSLGGLYLGLGNPGKALGYLQEAIRLAPDNLVALTNLGAAYVDLGDPGKAAGYLEQAVRLKPNDVAALHNLGGAYVQLGLPEKAVGYLQEALRLKSDDVLALTNLGAAYLDLANPGKAVDYLQEAIRLKPDDVLALTNLGAAYVDLGNPGKAAGYLREAVRLKPTFADALANLGWAYGELGLLEESVVCLRGAIAARPDHALAHFNLGIVLIRLRRDAEASAIWRTLQNIDPELARRLRWRMPGLDRPASSG